MKKATVLLFLFISISILSAAQSSTSFKDGHTIVNYIDKKGNPQWHYAAGCERMAVMQMEASVFCKLCSDKRKKEAELKKQQEESERQKKIQQAIEKQKADAEKQKQLNNLHEENNNNTIQKANYWSSSSNTNSNTSSNSKTFQNTNASSAIKTNNGNSANATGYQGDGRYESSGSGIIYPVGPGIKRADGNYNVVDQNGKTHIIDAKTNENLEIKQRDADAKQRMASQQQKIQEQFKQQETARQNQAEINRQRQAQINAFADQVSNSVYQIGTGIASMINDAKAKKERERQRQLEIKQREEALKLKLEQERQFRVGVRTNIFENYKESPFPISTTKIPYNKLYYFIYAYDNSMIDKEGLRVYVSERPFEIIKYSDGTWPYKKSVVDKIANITPFNEIITGYYSSYNEAVDALSFFKSNLFKSNVIFQEINYQYAKQATASQNAMNSFWKNTKDTIAVDSTKIQPKKDKYWK